MSHTTSLAGLRCAGSVEMGADGITMSAAPSDPDFSAVPDWTWAEVMHELEYMAAQLELPGVRR